MNDAHRAGANRLQNKQTVRAIVEGESVSFLPSFVRLFVLLSPRIVRVVSGVLGGAPEGEK